MKAVLISDIHFTVNTLELASQALVQAMTTAYHLDVPLIICGDTMDGKAIIRGEVANRLIGLFKDSIQKPKEIIVLVGNHDLLSEKSKEHALEFLKPYCTIIESAVIYDRRLALYLIPYISDLNALQGHLKAIPKGSTIIMHQGVQTAYMGHYVQDHTSLPKEAFDGFRVISGHYHRRQDIQCGETGLFSYVGNPYTLTFGEANDGPKGYCLLQQDGSLINQPLELRKHLIVNRTFLDWDDPIQDLNPGDLVWFKVTGTQSQLAVLKKQIIADKHFRGDKNFKLDKICTDDKTAVLPTETCNLKDEDVLDALIDKTKESPTQKEHLKKLWRKVMAK